MTKILKSKDDGTIEESYIYHSFKTVDDLVEYTKSMSNDKSIEHVITKIVIHDSTLLKSILISKSNIPSQYDLMIIIEISKYQYTKSGPSYSRWKSEVNEILEIYKNRK